MPTYDYKCRSCSHQFEQFQSMKDSPLRKCPKCGKAALERLIGTGAAVLFKGSGFYQTDYRSESYKAAEKAEKPSAEPAKAESKPAAAPAAGGADKPKAERKPAKPARKRG
jgi:putative FmdB family regulatory protein